MALLSEQIHIGFAIIDMFGNFPALLQGYFRAHAVNFPGLCGRVQTDCSKELSISRS